MEKTLLSCSRVYFRNAARRTCSWSPLVLAVGALPFPLRKGQGFLQGQDKGKGKDKGKFKNKGWDKGKGKGKYKDKGKPVTARGRRACPVWPSQPRTPDGLTPGSPPTAQALREQYVSVRLEA